MALSANTVWEIRTTGGDTNGGGFNQPTVFITTPIDYSQQNSPQYAVTDAVTNGTTTITSATGGFTAAMLGNLIYIQGGTGSITAGWYEITVYNSATSITVDRSTGLTTGTGATLNVGGAIATLGKLSAVMVSGNVAYVKNTATYTIGTGLTFSQGTASLITAIYGYTTTRGDNGRAAIQATANMDMITLSSLNFSLNNLELDGNSTTTRGLVNTNTNIQNFHANLKIHHCNSGAAFSSTGCLQFNFINCEFYSCGGTNGAVEANGLNMIACYVHDNTVTGLYASSNAGGVLINVISESNSGASSDGFSYHVGQAMYSCSAYNNGRDGIRTRTYGAGVSIYNCIFINNTGKGINISGASALTLIPSIAYNALYNNTGGNTSGFSSGATNIILTGTPFTDGPNGDFSLNALTAGLACKATGFPGVFPGGTTTSYSSRGAVTPDPTSGGGGSLIGDGLIGTT